MSGGVRTGSQGSSERVMSTGSTEWNRVFVQKSVSCHSHSSFFEVIRLFEEPDSHKNDVFLKKLVSVNRPLTITWSAGFALIFFQRKKAKRSADIRGRTCPTKLQLCLTTRDSINRCGDMAQWRRLLFLGQT